MCKYRYTYYIYFQHFLHIIFFCFQFCHRSLPKEFQEMALHLPTFTTTAAPILNYPFQHISKLSLQLHFSKPISRNHLSVPHSATQPQKYVYPDPIPEFAVAVIHS